MDVHVDELHTSFDTIGADSLLAPDVLERIVAAVRACLGAGHAQKCDRAADVDFRSVVEQQRAGRR
jgi:hypothetical protein